MLEKLRCIVTMSRGETMNFPRPTLLLALALAGCLSPRPSARAVQRGDATEADMQAAVSAARRSEYYPGTERYQVMASGRDQIFVLYFDPPGTCVIVKRVHGRWQAVDHTFWIS